METTFDFGAGPVPAARHKNPDGSEGGWVARTARVYGNAQVHGDAQVYGTALVYGNAQVHGDAQVYGNAQVYGAIPYAHRSDGHAFVAYPCADGIVRVSAGCRFFTFDQARDHWLSTRGGTPLGDETFDILRLLRKQSIRNGWRVK